MVSDKVNRWLTLGANIGVLIGIILILIELDQNADLLRAQMVQSRADAMNASIDADKNAEFWPEILAKRRAASSTEEWLNSLSPADYERVWMDYLQNINNLQHLHYQYQEGYMPDELWNGPVKRQFIRWLDLALVFGEDCSREEQFFAYVRELSATEKIAICGNSGRWQPIVGR